MGKYIMLPREVQYRVSSAFCVIAKIDKDHYKNKLTGEVLEYEHNEKRIDNARALRRTFDLIELTIKSNFDCAENCLWITFTYRRVNGKPMTDSRRLYDDFRKFRAKFFRLLEDKGVDEPRWLYVVEPQASGAWHIHMICDCGKPVYVANRVVEALWAQGFTKTRRMKGTDNIAAYLSSYLTSMRSEKGKEKKSRLKFYPTGMRIWRHSRNVERPPVETLDPLEAETKRRAHGLSLVATSRVRVLVLGTKGFFVLWNQRNKYKSFVDDLDGSLFVSDSGARVRDKCLATGEVRELVAKAEQDGRLGEMPSWVVDWVKTGRDTRDGLDTTPYVDDLDGGDRGGRE